MKQETFEKAKQLESRIDHISKVIDFVSKHDYSLNPPTRKASCSIYRKDDDWIDLNEGEAVLIRKSLEDEKIRLQQEFAFL